MIWGILGIYSTTYGEVSLWCGDSYLRAGLIGEDQRPRIASASDLGERSTGSGTKAVLSSMGRIEKIGSSESLMGRMWIGLASHGGTIPGFLLVLLASQGGTIPGLRCESVRAVICVMMNIFRSVDRTSGTLSDQSDAR